jgi:hypothetical protein
MFTEKLKIEEGSEYLPAVIVGLIVSIPGFADFCQDKFSDCHADVTSLKSNPGCSCRRRVERYVKTSPKQCYDALVEFYNANPSLHESLNLNINLNSWVDVGGKIVEIDNNEEAYAAFYENLHSKKYSYHGLEILDKGDKLRIYFL